MPTQVESLSRNASWEEIRRWRKLVREEFLARRGGLAVDTLRAVSERACAQLTRAVDLGKYEVLGFCWPIRGEFDVRSIAKQHLANGGQVALPVIVQKSAPVEFWSWSPGMAMHKGVWDIPTPKERNLLTLDAVIVPLVGFDKAGFRLGYGGGYFDRTLAAATRRPFAIGLGYEESSLQTIYPQLHDIPMDLVVTDQSVHRTHPAVLPEHNKDPTR
jgi:5-formyltetrahydrofolate cyclo-ligase